MREPDKGREREMSVWVLGSCSTVQRIQMLDKFDVSLTVYALASKTTVYIERRSAAAPGQQLERLISFLTYILKWKPEIRESASVIGHWVLSHVKSKI